jgi:hypothetical protein
VPPPALFTTIDNSEESRLIDDFDVSPSETSSTLPPSIGPLPAEIETEPPTAVAESPPVITRLAPFSFALLPGESLIAPAVFCEFPEDMSTSPDDEYGEEPVSRRIGPLPDTLP